MAKVARQKILVVDDDENVRVMVRRLLESSHYEVDTADDGPAGLELAKRKHFDLVVVDGLLPKMHGFLLCKAIKELAIPPKVILFTGVYTKPNYRWEATKRYGADDLVPKGSRPVDLVNAIKRHLPETMNPDIFDIDARLDNLELKDASEVKPREKVEPVEPEPVLRPSVESAPDDVNFALLNLSDY